MKISEVTITTSHIIKTDDEEYPYWRRNSSNSWENLMGESWEAMEPPEGFEEAFKKFMGHQKVVVKKQNATSITYAAV